MKEICLSLEGIAQQFLTQIEREEGWPSEKILCKEYIHQLPNRRDLENDINAFDTEDRRVLYPPNYPGENEVGSGYPSVIEQQLKSGPPLLSDEVRL